MVVVRMVNKLPNKLYLEALIFSQKPKSWLSNASSADQDILMTYPNVP